ncbi:MAG: hypothetical protein AXA67_05300 [Methylothermaceae bacteria B42]|nr:MAG: hypothetical protein AXA67_05300 [Methylothermaceae bacteria B42]HHJ39384.1 4'-phosphopantetheinyl transferase superfamily protein [Methylothermaceae bacterium]
MLNDAIHVIRAQLEVDDTALSFLRPLLADEELEKASRLIQPVHQKRYIASMGILRSVLATYVGQHPKDLQFVRGQWGKPRLAGRAENEGLVFNVSHSQEQMVIAIGYDRPLGVDVESIRPIKTLAGMAKRCFSQHEFEAWTNLPAPERKTAFFRFWTLKEAFVKADGRGLGLGVQQCVFSLREGVPKIVSVPSSCGKPADWSVCELIIDDGFKGALCTRGEFQLIYRDFPVDLTRIFHQHPG